MSTCLLVSYSSATIEDPAFLLGTDDVWDLICSLFSTLCPCLLSLRSLVPSRPFTPTAVVATAPSLSETLLLLVVGLCLPSVSLDKVSLSTTACFTSLLAAVVVPELALCGDGVGFPVSVTLTDLDLGVDEEGSVKMVRVVEVGVTRDSPVGEMVAVVEVLLRSRREKTDPATVLSFWAAGTSPVRGEGSQ